LQSYPGGTSLGHGWAGKDGIGKTVLSQALCHDRPVQNAFPDGVIWTTIGRNPTNLFLKNQMRDIAKLVGGDLAYYDRLQAYSNEFHRTLKNKAALIVLDDVWNGRDIEPFIYPGEPLDARYRLLITTTGQEVSRYENGLLLDVLAPDQALELLARWGDTPAAELSPAASEVIEACGHLPLAISMIGALVRGGGFEPWKGDLRRLKEADLEMIRIQFPDYPDPNLLSAIQVSVDALQPECRVKYLGLAIF